MHVSIASFIILLIHPVVYSVDQQRLTLFSTFPSDNDSISAVFVNVSTFPEVAMMIYK